MEWHMWQIVFSKDGQPQYIPSHMLFLQSNTGILPSAGGVYAFPLNLSSFCDFQSGVWW